MAGVSDKRSQQRVYALVALSLCACATVMLTSLASPREASAGWPWKWRRGLPPCGHSGCHRDRCTAATGWAGNWYWMRSPDQEQRVVMSHFNRYCIRCHGTDGRGVWDIPDVPDFTDPRWQNSRSDAQIVNIIMEGRGAVMPMFRGTLALDEAWAMAHYLRSFVPGTETPRPDAGRARTQRAKPEAPSAPTSSIPPPVIVQ